MSLIISAFTTEPPLQKTILTNLLITGKAHFLSSQMVSLLYPPRSPAPPLVPFLRAFSFSSLRSRMVRGRFSGPHTQTLTLVSWGHMLTWGGPECSHLPAFQLLQGRSVRECLSLSHTHTVHSVSLLIVIWQWSLVVHQIFCFYWAGRNVNSLLDQIYNTLPFRLILI